jgi:thiol:disulfide interchange protein DsbC
MLKKLIIPMVSAGILMEANYLPVKKDPFVQLKIIKENGIVIEEAYDNGSLYHLKISAGQKRGEMFVTKDMGSVIFGEGYNTKSGDKYHIPVNVAPFLSQSAFTYGEGKDEYLVFTDPQCPYCVKFENNWEAIKSKVKFHIFWFPLGFHHDAKSMIYHIMSQPKEKRFETLRKISKGSLAYKNTTLTPAQQKEYDKVLAKHLEFASKLSVQGTPATFTKDGVPIVWPKIIKKY